MGLKIIDGTPTAISKYLREEDLKKEIESNSDKTLNKMIERELDLKKELEKGCGKNALIPFMECEEGNLCQFCKGRLEGFKQALSTQKQEFLKMIDEIENPYPIDIYPEINEEVFKEIHKELEKKFKMPLDRLSADLMRRARETLKDSQKN